MCCWWSKNEGRQSRCRDIDREGMSEQRRAYIELEEEGRRRRGEEGGGGEEEEGGGEGREMIKER